MPREPLYVKGRLRFAGGQQHRESERMLLVRIYVAPSRIHGLGVFAAEPLKAGALISVFDSSIDQEISDEQLTCHCRVLTDDSRG